MLSAAPALDHHDTGVRHPERPERVIAALAGIDDAGLRDAVVDLAPRRALPDELTRVHPQDYLDSVEAFCRSGGGAIDPDTTVGPGSWDTALLAAGGVLAAIEGLEAGRGETAFVAARPPGHHALAEQSMGFCLINNIAVGAAALAERGERVLIVDFDVHHGNGTQAIFWNDPRVLYISTHEWPLYPGTGRAEETGGPGAPGLTMNVPLPAGATGDVLLRAADELMAPAVENFDPTWVLVSAGFDAHRADPLAQLRLTAGDFADLMGRIRGFAPAPGRTVVVLEGGYDLDALRLSVGATLARVLDRAYRPEQSSAGGPGGFAIDAVHRVFAETPPFQRSEAPPSTDRT
ncbi:MAG TPA: histone deacetylase [Acidimicrobiales bacterium]